MPLQLPAHSFHIPYLMRLVSACLVGSLPVPFLVSLVVASYLRLLLASLQFLVIMASRIASRHAPLLASPHRPDDRVEKRGDAIVLLTVMRGVSACLARFRYRLNAFPGNLLKLSLTIF